jgi:hypothetical protein
MSTSNIGDVTAWLDKFVDRFDMQRQIGPRSLGRDIAHKAVELIQDRSLQERTGHGTAWPPNSETPSKYQPEGYKGWKEKHYGTGDPNSRTGQMLSKESLYGRTKVEAKQVTMVYGTDTPPTRATFGTPTPNQLARDQKVTDTFKAYLAHTGQSKKKIVRPFYQLIDSDGPEVMEVARERLVEYINQTNRDNGY